MEDALLEHLLTDATLATLVPDQAIRWAAREGDVCLALWLIGAPPDWHLKGASGVVMSRVQADCWALDFLTAKAIGDAFKAALPATGQVIGGIKFQGCVILDTERTQTGEAPNVRHRTRIDVRITHKPAN